MNPLISEALAAIIRSILMTGAGYLVAKDIWSPEDASKYVAAAALAVVGLGWSLWHKYKSRLKLLTALSSPTQLTEKQAEAVVKAGNAPRASSAKNVVPSALLLPKT